MRVFYSDHFTIALPAGHRFPMSKYRRVREALEARVDPRLRFGQAPAAARATLALAHSPAYVDRVFAGTLSPAEQRALGFPWSEALVERSRRSVGATLAALAAAREEGVAASLAGGTHHAGRARGAGFCVFNDVAVAALETRRSDRHARVLLVDCDVHQGDGSAEILAAADGIYALSVHAARNYPHRKPASHLDVALPDGTADAPYQEALASALAHALRVARPSLVIYLAGADVFAGDRLGRLALSKAGIAARDRLVLESAEAAGAALVMVMGGGYAPVIDDIVDIHAASVLLAADSWQRRTAGSEQQAFGLTPAGTQDALDQ